MMEFEIKRTREKEACIYKTLYVKKALSDGMGLRPECVTPLSRLRRQPHRRGKAIPGPWRARQSRRFLETGSLFPPLAALRRFPPPGEAQGKAPLEGSCQRS